MDDNRPNQNPPPVPGHPSKAQKRLSIVLPLPLDSDYSETATNRNGSIVSRPEPRHNFSEGPWYPIEDLETILLVGHWPQIGSSIQVASPLDEEPSTNTRHKFWRGDC
jgi:hypothetical protein